MPASGAAASTTVTIKIANCEGCKVFPISIMAADPRRRRGSATEKMVKDGEVTFKVPTDRTAGLGRRRERPVGASIFRGRRSW